ncbi:MAG: hypothetical protein D3910_14195, partial [Candidatus Electrothrix sp. ATG2]|nr:hypothetical protein [Candidatus Electrothrix sp. ATG2]
EGKGESSYTATDNKYICQKHSVSLEMKAVEVAIQPPVKLHGLLSRPTEAQKECLYEIQRSGKKYSAILLQGKNTNKE